MRAKLFAAFVLVAAVGCGTSSAPQPAADDYVLSVPGMH
jgi:hypothetical protein